MKNMLFCISGPSGVGKGTLVRELLKREAGLSLSVSATTRAPRKGERDGADYHFVTAEAFRKGIEDDAFIEFDGHFGEYYGTPRPFVEAELNAGRSVILEIDVNGALKVKRTETRVPVCTVFIAPPSLETLEARLRGRGSESPAQMEVRRARVGYELSKKDEFDYVVVNDRLEEAIQALRGVIRKEIERQ